jgi:hypothetical protein
LSHKNFRFRQIHSINHNIIDMMNAPAYHPSDNTMGYAFAQPPPPQGQQQQQTSFPSSSHYQQELVPHYGPASNDVYHNYQVPSAYSPEYVSYQSSTVAARPSNPPDLLESAASSYSSSNSYPQPSNTADDVMAIFESTPPATVTPPPASAAQDDAFLRSFTAEEIAEQERLMNEIETRKSLVKSAPAGDITVYEQQDRLWNSIHQDHPSNNAMVPHSSSTTVPHPLTVYDYDTHEHKLVRVPSSHNPTGSDAVHPRRKEMKQARKIKQATAATGGAIVGGVLFGPAWPIGVVAGGAVGAVAGKQISKAGERRAQRKWEKKSFQQYAASESAVVKGEHDLL